MLPHFMQAIYLMQYVMLTHIIGCNTNKIDNPNSNPTSKKHSFIVLTSKYLLYLCPPMLTNCTLCLSYPYETNRNSRTSVKDEIQYGYLNLISREQHLVLLFVDLFCSSLYTENAVMFTFIAYPNNICLIEIKSVLFSSRVLCCYQTQTKMLLCKNDLVHLACIQRIYKT